MFIHLGPFLACMTDLTKYPESSIDRWYEIAHGTVY